ncbi:MAG: glycosyl transferase family 2 [Acidobacteriales bacterium]|nr:glycosyl transferase family 2 [Terriglobales bacterium]
MSSAVSPQENLSCAVVICTRNRSVQLEKCLAAVSEQTLKPAEIIVVDNAPDDNSTRETASRWGVQYVVEPQLGLSRARNRGASESRSDIVAYIDDDALPQRDWLAQFVTVFQQPEILAAGGRTVPPQESAEVVQLCSMIQGPGTALEPLIVDKAHPQWFEITAFGGLGGGGNMALRRSAFSQWGGFDERLGFPGAAGEEQFAVFSLVDKGHRVAYVPEAVVTHPSVYTVEGLRARYLEGCAYATSYLLFLFFQAPRYRTQLLKFVYEGFKGVRREWRHAPESPRAKTGLGRSKIFAARLRGLWLYFRLRNRTAHNASSSS